jgi:hypothetical protein
MMLVPPYGPQRENKRGRVWVLFVVIACCGGVWAGATTMHPPIVAAMDDATPWSVTVHISESGGAGNTVVFGQKPDASDGQDEYDLPEPPSPPQLPYLLAWFQTPFPAPYAQLLHEYKHCPSSRSVWNLSILWVAMPGNASSTVITMTWNPPANKTSDHFSLLLYENNTVIADILTDHSYSFHTTGAVHRFSIIYESSSSTNASETPGVPVIPLLVGTTIVIVLVLGVVIAYRARKT